MVEAPEETVFKGFGKDLQMVSVTAREIGFPEKTWRILARAGDRLQKTDGTKTIPVPKGYVIIKKIGIPNPDTPSN